MLRAIREDETVAAVAGKTVVRFKVQAFVIGAAVAGLAGVLFGHYLAYIEPNMFLPQETLFVWLALILGGSGNNRGAILGAVLLLGLLKGSRFVKDVIPFLTGVRLAAAQQRRTGILLVAAADDPPAGGPTARAIANSGGSAPLPKPSPKNSIARAKPALEAERTV